MIDRRTCVALCTSGVLVACGSGTGASGSLNVSASGEEAARTGYPLVTGEDAITFADGWTLRFRNVVVSLADFSARTADGDDAALDGDPVVADLHLGEPVLWDFPDVPARRWDRVGYRYVPASDGARSANDVDPRALELMIEQGYSLLVRAVAEKDGLEVELDYGFGFEVEHTQCVNGLDGTDGLVVPSGGAAEAQITLHLDHLFFDTYATDGAALRFDAMAAVAPGDRPLALHDLAAQDSLSDLRGRDGRPLELAYDSGSAFEPVPRDLREYVIAAATTTGHFNGEGHCDYERADD